MNYPKIFQILNEADRTIDQLDESFKSSNYQKVSETLSILVSMIEQLRKLAGEEIPPDDVDKPKLLEIVDLAFTVIADVKVAIDSQEQNKFNAELYLLSLALDDIFEIIIDQDISPD